MKFSNSALNTVTSYRISSIATSVSVAINNVSNQSFSWKVYGGNSCNMNVILDTKTNILFSSSSSASLALKSLDDSYKEFPISTPTSNAYYIFEITGG